MRLWHIDLISKLPRQQLLGQHRECCALRGNGWGKKHATVNYVFKYSPVVLYEYHVLIMNEMAHRGYKAGVEWFYSLYRGKSCSELTAEGVMGVYKDKYPEHTNEYLWECLDNLAGKGIIINMEVSHES